jgi:hypothetical protein
VGRRDLRDDARKDVGGTATVTTRLKFSHWRTLPAKDDLAGARVPERAQAVVGIADLTDLDRRQLVACAGRGSDLVFTVEDLFSEGFRSGGRDRSWIGESTEVPFEWWDVVDGEDGVRYQVWFYHADGALVFVAGTTDVVLQGIQFGSAWEIERDLTVEEQAAFVEAQQSAIKAYPKSDLAQHYAFEP